MLREHVTTPGKNRSPNLLITIENPSENLPLFTVRSGVNLAFLVIVFAMVDGFSALRQGKHLFFADMRTIAEKEPFV